MDIKLCKNFECVVMFKQLVLLFFLLEVLWYPIEISRLFSVRMNTELLYQRPPYMFISIVWMSACLLSLKYSLTDLLVMAVVC